MERESKMTGSVMITEQSVLVFASDRSYTRSNELSIMVKKENNQIKKESPKKMERYSFELEVKLRKRSSSEVRP